MSDKCPYTYFSNLIVGETTCDGKKKMYELLSELKPVYVLHLPQGREEYALDMWTSELHRFIAFLEQRFHVAITDEALRAAARQRNAERQARMELMAVQKRLPPPAFGQQLYKALDGAGFVFAAETRIQQLDDLRQSLLTAYERGERPDVIVIDPPRKGCDAAVITSIAAMRPTRVVYVSCDPATLARDVKLLTEKGYTLRSAEAVDLFPKCAHVETVVLLSKF